MEGTPKNCMASLRGEEGKVVRKDGEALGTVMGGWPGGGPDSAPNLCQEAC